jgi:hypothetical protein
MKAHLKIAGSTVTVVFTTDYPIGGWTWPFTFVAPNEWSAALLQTELQSQLELHVKQLRERAYLEGWNDAKKKKRKQTWWSCCFNVDAIR